MSRIILASQSPRRKQLLSQIGIKGFEILVPEADETFDPALSPEELRSRTRAALEKLEDFRSQECAAIVEDLLLHHMPQAAETGLLEIQAQLRLYEDDNAEDLLRQLLGRLEEEEGSQ